MKEIITYNQNNNFTIQYKFSDIEFQILEKIYFAHYNKNFSNNFGMINSKDLSKNERDYINKFNHPFNQRMLIIDYDRKTIELTFFARQLMFETLSIGYVVKYFDEEDDIWQSECDFKNKEIAEAYLNFAEKSDSMNRKIETFRYGKYSTIKFADEDYAHLKNINDESNNKK